MVKKARIHVPYLRLSRDKRGFHAAWSRVEADKNEKVHFAKRSGISIVKLSSNLRDNHGLSPATFKESVRPAFAGRIDGTELVVDYVYSQTTDSFIPAKDIQTSIYMVTRHDVDVV